MSLHNSSTPLMEIESLSMCFGGLTAVDKVSVTVRTGEILAIIGPNGAGKTTLFNAITGMYEPTRGKVCVEGKILGESSGFNPLDLFYAGLFGVCAAVFLNISTLWENSINSVYSYGNKFDWALAGRQAASTILDDSITYLVFFAASAVIALVSLIKIRGEFHYTPAVCNVAGLARTFQNIRIFKTLTVFENVLVACAGQKDVSFFSALFPILFEKKVSDKGKKTTEQILKELGLYEKRNLPAASLSYGERRRLEIARALATEPKVLLLDEPAAGLNPTEGRLLSEAISKIRSQGIAIVLIEHHMKVVMEISDRIVVLHYGKKIAEGSPEEIRNDTAVIEAYLGGAPVGDAKA